MKKIVPYEHNVKLIKSISNKSIKGLNKLYQKFISTEDKWIKKLLALRILDSMLISQVDFDLNELQKSTECQIKV